MRKRLIAIFMRIKWLCSIRCVNNNLEQNLYKYGTNKVRNGHIKRITDADIQSSVLEIMGTNVSTTYIQCPSDKEKTLGIKLPFLVMIIKNVSQELISNSYEFVLTPLIVEEILYFRSSGARRQRSEKKV